MDRIDRMKAVECVSLSNNLDKILVVLPDQAGWEREAEVIPFSLNAYRI